VTSPTAWAKVMVNGTPTLMAEKSALVMITACETAALRTARMAEVKRILMDL